MTIPPPSLAQPPQPIRKTFDPFNSSSTGHQRAENSLSSTTSWRVSRAYKLSHQLKDTSGGGGDQHRADLVGAGSQGFGVDGRKANGDWEPGAPGLRGQGWQDIRTLMNGTTKRKITEYEGAADQDRKKAKHVQRTSSIALTEYSRYSSHSHTSIHLRSTSDHIGGLKAGSEIEPVQMKLPESTSTSITKSDALPQIFAGLTIYLNGSTAPLVSDHRLKQLLGQHGANVSIVLGRRTVTHVILGGKDKGGGGLAAGKLEKEVARVGRKGVKFVGAEWVLDSIKAGTRLPEGKFQMVHLAQRGQKSVYGMFEGAKQEAGQTNGSVMNS